MLKKLLKKIFYVFSYEYDKDQIEKYLSKIPYQNSDITGFNIFNVTASSDTNSSLISIEARSEDPLKDPIFLVIHHFHIFSSFCFIKSSGVGASGSSAPATGGAGVSD